uniref:Uncharacterized protein n=1 Tax=Romanomermis culicivorax TaxID=13658 RepID=A0A915L2K0_ROMCU
MVAFGMGRIVPRCRNRTGFIIIKTEHEKNHHLAQDLKSQTLLTKPFLRCYGHLRLRKFA